MNNSPYYGKPIADYFSITSELVNAHPLKDELKDVVLQSWDDIFKSNLGGFKIGRDIFPEPQNMGFFLHELIALHLSKAHPKVLKRGDAGTEKDIHCIPNPDLGIEIKTSSDKSHIFANRSYAQPENGTTKKWKDGYFLAVNFEKFSAKCVRPEIRLIRFGYLEHSDWIAQKSSSGQQARLAPETYKNKFVELYAKN